MLFSKKIINFMLHYLTQLVGPQSISLLVFGMKGLTFFLLSVYANSQFSIWTSQICQIDNYVSLPFKLTNVNMTHTSTKYIKHNRNRLREERVDFYDATIQWLRS